MRNLNCRVAAVLFAVLAVFVVPQTALARLIGEPAAPIKLSEPIAAQLFSVSEPVRLQRIETPVPAWRVTAGGTLLGYVGSTYEIGKSVGYSGHPIDMLVAVDMQGQIAGSELMRHSEPILTLGLSHDDIANFVSGFVGYDLLTGHRRDDATGADIITRATVTSGVIRDSILRTARTLALGFGVVPGGGIDRTTFTSRDWPGLVADGALAHRRFTLNDARAALPGAKPEIPAGDKPFIEFWAGIADAPVIGQNLLGQAAFNRQIATEAPGEVLLFVASTGLYSHRGSAWRKTGVFDRLTLVQGTERLQFSDDAYSRVDKLVIDGAPGLREMSLFRLPTDHFDPTEPFYLELSVTRDAADGSALSTIVALDYTLPSALVLAPPPKPVPLWEESWERRKLTIIGVVTMLGFLTLILFFQQAFVTRPRLWRWGRTAFLTLTLVWLGLGVNGQLSVVQVMAFLHSMLNGFHWETFLIEPVIFILWSFVALGLLFWGRGVYCGWLCPFGALQELSNLIAQKLRVPQLKIPFAVHERLWVIKYSAFVGLIAVSLYSMNEALVLAEVEPFKTAISMRMMRAWPFVLYVLVIIIAGLFIERFYCRYLCALGAGLAIPAKLKIFDWLNRRPQCGRECRLCEQKCTVGAIDPLGRINPNECVLCLRCQVIYSDPNTCIILKRRQRAGASQ